MTRVAFVIPGNIDLPTGGYAYDRRVLALLPEHGIEVRHLALPGSYPAPTSADLATTAERIAATPPDTVLLIDGLAYGAMPADLIRRFERRIVALVHHPLCLEAGLPEARQHELRRLEAEASTLARRVVVTSPLTATTLASDFGVPDDRITVAIPGTDPAERARGGAGKTLRLLAVGSIIPRKGYDLLIDALAPLKVLPWHLDVVGSAELSPETVTKLRAQIARLGLADRVTLHGAATDLAPHYDRADVFVMSSLYEGFGMVLTEALARGLAIVTTTGGAAADTVPDDAAIKCEPGDSRLLMWAVGRAIEQPELRKRVANEAWKAAASLQRWPDTARIVANVLKDAAR